MNIQELKLKSSEQLITQAEELGIENASTLRKTGNSFLLF
jgi:transcription termination factor Rho